MAKIVKKNELTAEFLLALFDDAGFAPKADEDGDLYISGEVTCHCEFPPELIRVRPFEGRTNEEAEIYRRADYRGAEGA